jgi:very-short-patch-repair endonuclease
MSPLSVAQYLEASHETFDVVIFDEASQIPVWDAVGAIARGRQLIIVGDPKQLPPTNFFSTHTDDEEDLTPEEHKDLESILDELMTHGLRHKRLQWHYRSRHEGLITFSNRQYYDNDLLTFPSPELELGGVRFRHVPNARYDKGRSRTNRLEAEALVKELVSRLRDPASPRRSYGVVTFSQAQQALVENLIDEERRKYPEIEHHFGDEPPVEGEPVFVKNLENVQGDERDIIFFSICYGMDEAGKLSMNFGPLNRDGGERRLNVAVTRAKHEVLVFSGLRGDQIDLTRTQRRGVRDLKYFLEYAERGPKALVAATTGASLEDADSEFERMVADRIRKAGYEVHHQVGCSGYRIDLAVVDPMSPGRYLLGVECDGATYHRAATARDRDKLRQAVLEDLGWKLHRIWSTDWWHGADSEIAKLLLKIEQLNEERQLEMAALQERAESTPDTTAGSQTEGQDTLSEESVLPPPESSVPAPGGSRYQIADFGVLAVEISADKFHEPSYDETLVLLIAHVLTTEAPISDDLLVNRLARAHGFQRSGRLIQDRVIDMAKRHFHVRPDPIEGVFIWPDQDSPDTWSGFRTHHSEEGSRKIEEIAFEELHAAIITVSSGDIPVEVARIFGSRRLAASSRIRLEKVLGKISQRQTGESE